MRLLFDGDSGESFQTSSRRRETRDRSEETSRRTRTQTGAQRPGGGAEDESGERSDKALQRSRTGSIYYSAAMNHGTTCGGADTDQRAVCVYVVCSVLWGIQSECFGAGRTGT